MNILELARQFVIFTAFAQEKIKLGLPFAGESGYDSFNEYFAALITYGLVAAATMATGVIVYAGILYSSSKGSAEGVNKAKELASGSITGLIILLLIKLILPTLNINSL